MRKAIEETIPGCNIIGFRSEGLELREGGWCEARSRAAHPPLEMLPTPEADGKSQGTVMLALSLLHSYIKLFSTNSANPRGTAVSRRHGPDLLGHRFREDLGNHNMAVGLIPKRDG